MESKGVLIVATPSLLLAIDPARLTTSPEKDLECQIPPPPVFKVLNLVQQGFPYGMRFFVRESKLYLIGGEKILEGFPLEELYYLRGRGDRLDASFGTKGVSPYIYVSDLTTPDSITDLRKLPTTMLGPKPNPYIAEVEGKIYVLSGNPRFYAEEELLFPTFEVYDPSMGQWEALPDPPFYNPEEWRFQIDDEIHGISVVGTSIYVKATENYYSYNVNTKIWDSLGSEHSATPLLQPMPIHFQPGKFVPAYDDIFIGLHGCNLFAVLIHRNGSPSTYQFFGEVFDEYHKHDYIYSYSGAVIDMGGKEMCVIKACSWEGKGTCAYIATFRVEKLHSSAQAPELAPVPKIAKTTAASSPGQDRAQPKRFLSVTCLTKGFYNLDSWGPEIPLIKSAYFHSWEG